MYVANIDTLTPDTTNQTLTSFTLNLQTDIQMTTKYALSAEEVVPDSASPQVVSCLHT